MYSNVKVWPPNGGPTLPKKVHFFDERESKLPEVLPRKLHLVWPVDFGEDNFKFFFLCNYIYVKIQPQYGLYLTPGIMI